MNTFLNILFWEFIFLNKLGNTFFLIKISFYNQIFIRDMLFGIHLKFDATTIQPDILVLKLCTKNSANLRKHSSEIFN